MNFEDPVGGYVTTETVYGTNEDSHVVMSEKVQSLAGSIYQEFERMIARYDEDVVKTLMPLLVNVLECLDSAYQTNQENDVELELLREDNEQLVTQYEREKASRKHAEQKLLESEDHYEGERKDLISRLETLDSIVRMLELKHKNSQDHASRLEERENELKKEYAKLHERYTELFKTHMEYMDRTKLLLSTANDRTEVRGRLGLNPMGRSSGPISFGFTSLEGSVNVVEHTESMPGSPVSLSSSPSSNIGAEIMNTLEKSNQTELLKQSTQFTIDQATSPVTGSVSKSQTKSEKRSANTLYQELSFNDNEPGAADADESTDVVTGSWVHPGEYASSVNDNYFGMGKEVENLILENNELLATKNALNVVKDDLIVKVDELTGEQEILREEISNLNSTREKLRERVSQLEDEVRLLKETVNNSAGGGEAEEEADVPMAQRKRFTRVEMARVLMERNQYKERFMELQDAVRYTEIMRASHATMIDKKNKQTIWQFFSNLFSAGNERPHRPLSTPHLRAVAVPQPSMRHSRTQADFLGTQLTDQRRQDRSDQYRQVRAHVRKEDGRTHAYGWSLPGKGSQAPKPPSPGAVTAHAPAVPVPVFCRPIAESEPRMSLSCASAVNLFEAWVPELGGPEDCFNVVSLADEMCIAQSDRTPELERVTEQIKETLRLDSRDPNLATVCICSSNDTKGFVMIIDANKPAEVIEMFTLSDKHILCVASVAAAVSGDSAETSDSEPVTQEHASFKKGGSIGSGSVGSSKDSKGDEIEIGSIKLIKASVFVPPITPKNAKSGAEATKDPNSKTGDASESESPPLDSSPVSELASPEPGVEAFAQQQLQEVHPSTAEATLWLGTKSGNIYIHPATGNYSKCLARVKVSDAVLAIVSCSSRSVVALADGTVAIFARKPDGQWDFSQYWNMVLGDPKCSVRCLCMVGSAVWCGYRNKVYVIEPRTRTLLNSFDAHPRQESQLRQMVCNGDGVWVSIKMDSALRLYHAQTYQHLMDVDIEPYVSKMLGTGKLGFSLVRITSLLISNGRLWIGTSNGVIISVPLTYTSRLPSDANAPNYSSLANFAGDAHVLNEGASSPSSRIPLCNMAQAQLSFHGHRDAVKFFVAVPGAATSPVRSPSWQAAPALPDPTLRLNPPLPPMLVLSGGEGYIDFRIADSEMESSVVIAEDESANDKLSKSHLIVWQVARP